MSKCPLECGPWIYLSHGPVLWLVAQLCPTLRPHGLQPARLLCPWDSPGKNTGVGCHALLQGIFPTPGSNPDLLHCRWILYHLSQQGSPRTLEWWPIPSPGGLPDSGIKLGSPALQADSLPAELPGKQWSTNVGQVFAHWNKFSWNGWRGGDVNCHYLMGGWRNDLLCSQRVTM